MLEWLASECLKMIWLLKRLRITAHCGWIQAHQSECLLSQRSDLEPCLGSWPMPSTVETADGEGQMADQCQMVKEPVVESAIACLCDCQGESLHQSLWQQLMDSVGKYIMHHRKHIVRIHCPIVQTIHMRTPKRYSIHHWWCRSGMVSCNIQPLMTQTLVLTFFLSPDLCLKVLTASHLVPPLLLAWFFPW